MIADLIGRGRGCASGGTGRVGLRRGVDKERVGVEKSI